MNVSVVMNSVGEREDWFHEAVSDVLGQYKVDVHLILCTIEGDNCLKWIKKYEGDIETLVIKKKDHPGKGPNGSFYQLNKAVQLIKNDWFIFASSNCRLVGHKYHTEISKCLKEGKKVCYSDMFITDEDLNIKRRTYFGPYSIKKHLSSNFIPDQSMASSELIKKYLPFRTLWFNCGYWDMWLRIYREEGNVFTYNDQPVRWYRRDDDSMSVKRSKNPKEHEEYLRQQQLFLKEHRQWL